MHIFDKERNFLGGHGIVGAQIPMGLGVAFAEKYAGTKNLCIAKMGDGAVRQGAVHEAFNLAMIYKTPVIFVIENNGYAMGTSVARTSNVTELYKIGEAYDMPSFPVDGMNVEAVHEAVAEAAARARRGAPQLRARRSRRQGAGRTLRPRCAARPRRRPRRTPPGGAHCARTGRFQRQPATRTRLVASADACRPRFGGGAAQPRAHRASPPPLRRGMGVDQARPHPRARRSGTQEASDTVAVHGMAHAPTARCEVTLPWPGRASGPREGAALGRVAHAAADRSQNQTGTPE